MSNDGTLPLEILTYILSRLPVKSLCRFKCVSPSWNSLISSPYFAKTHLNRTKTLKNPNQKILVVGGNLLYSVDFADTNPTAAKLNLPTAEQPPENRVHVYNSCDGLVLVSHGSGAGTELFLLNPSTRECKKLPLFPFVLDAANSFHTNLCGVGYDSSTDDYKVVMVSPAWSQSSPRWAGVLTVAVYSLKTDSWRRIEDTNFFFVGSSGRVFVNGCLHGICWRDGSHVIVAFDLSNEVVREVPQPTSYIGSDVVLYHVAVLGGCLCLIDKQASEFWKMEEYGVRESWTKFKIPSRLFERSLFLLAEDEFLVNTSPGRQPKQLVVYNSRKDTMRNMVVCGIPEFFFFEGTYVESLIYPHHGGGMGDNE